MTTRDIFKARLLLLADFLEKLPPERFNFTHWVGLSWGGLPDLSCGTTACGLGWASTMPEFQALGLHLSSHHVKGKPHPSSIHPRLRGDNTQDFWEAICHATKQIWGLDPTDSEHLFTPTDTEADEPSAVDPEFLMDPLSIGEDGRLSRRAPPARLAQHIREYVTTIYGKI